MFLAAVDGSNLAPNHREFIPLFTRSHIVVAGFQKHRQQYMPHWETQRPKLPSQFRPENANDHLGPQAACMSIHMEAKEAPFKTSVWAVFNSPWGPLHIANPGFLQHLVDFMAVFRP